MDLKQLTKNKFFEPVLLFCLFYLPGYIQQYRGANFDIFNSIEYHIFYILTVLPQILLTLYLMKYSPVNLEMLPDDTSWTEFYFVRKITSRTILRALAAAGIMLAISYGISLIIFASGMSSPVSDNSWAISSPLLLTVFILTSQITGWSEELFFRGFLLRRVCFQKENVMLPAVIVSFIFGTGHIYQGFSGILITSSLGLFLAWFYLKKQDLIAAAIAHGLYNMVIMLIASAVSSYT